MYMDEKTTTKRREERGEEGREWRVRGEKVREFENGGVGR